MSRLEPVVPGTDRRVSTVGEAVRLTEHLWRNGAYQDYERDELVEMIRTKLHATDAPSQLPDWPESKRGEFVQKARLVLGMPSNRPPSGTEPPLNTAD